MAQTQVGVTVNNTATLTFAVGLDTGLTLVSDPLGNSDLSGTGAPTTFEVDRKIDLSVSLTTSATAVPGEDDVVVEFLVTNDTNDTMDFILQAEADGAGLTLVNTGLTDPGGSELTATDAPPAYLVFVENGSNAGYQVGEDTATVVDDLATSGTAIVYVVIDLANGTAMAADDYLFVSLVARAADSTTGILIAGDSNGYKADNTAQVPGDATADVTGSVDNVFADGASLLAYTGAAFEAADKERNGQLSATGLIVIDSGLEITKDVTTIFDTLNQDTSPKAIPGAYLQYTITIENLSTAAAFTLTSISDVITVASLDFDLSLLDPTSCTFAIVAPGPGDPAQTFDPTDVAAACLGLDGNPYVGGTSILEATFTPNGAAAVDAYLPSGGAVTYAAPNLTVNFATLLATGVFTGITFSTPGELAAGDKIELVFNVILK